MFSKSTIVDSQSFLLGIFVFADLTATWSHAHVKAGRGGDSGFLLGSFVAREGRGREELTDWLAAAPVSGRAPGWRCSRSSTDPGSGC